MQKTAPEHEKSKPLGPARLRLISGPLPARSAPGDVALSIHELTRYAQDWLFEAEYSNQSRRTIGEKRAVIEKLLWFLNYRNCDLCGVSELRQFLAYLRNGHAEPGGRWGNPLCVKPLRPTTLRNYYVYLQGMFGWMVREGYLPTSPIARLERPVARPEQVRPFSQDQIAALLRAARLSLHPRRDEAIVWLLFDTGVRASELCSLKVGDVDLSGRSITVMGKGNKVRKVPFGRQCWKAISLYLRERYRSEDQPLFPSDRGTRYREALTRSGLQQLVERLGAVAGIKGVRCSCHTFRHSFAIEFLRNGGNVFSLQQMLGHSQIQVTSRYVAMAQADIEQQHRQFSPADRIKA